MSGNENHIYIAIDLKSFYASVECRERDLDPLLGDVYKRQACERGQSGEIAEAAEKNV